MSGEAVFEGSCGLSYVLVSGSASLTFYEVYYIVCVAIGVLGGSRKE